MGEDTLFRAVGDIAVVTGGLGQLGMEYVLALSSRGVKVVVIDVVAEPKVAAPGFDEAYEKGNIRMWKADITDKSAVEKVLSEVREEWGVPSILINNAALDSPPDAPASEVGPFESYPIESYDKVMDVNVKGTLICSQVFGGAMAAGNGGSIVNISSIYGILSPCQDIYEFRRMNGEVFFKPVAYSISKSAIMNLTRYLATYWAGKGVRVNTLTLAGVFNNQPKEFLEAYCPRVPLGRMADPLEYVGPVLFLVSEAASYVTGSNLVADGGWSAW